jgi:hypothetical protein
MFGDYMDRLREQQELYSRWAIMQGREPSWSDFMRYSGNPEAETYITELQEERQSPKVDDLPEYGPRGQEEVTATPVAAEVKAEDKTDKDDDLWNQIFLMSLMEEMQGGDPGQAPGVVLGARGGNLPSMMGQFSRQRKPWWIV